MYQKGEEPVPEGPAPEVASLGDGRGPGQVPERFTTTQALPAQPLPAQAQGAVVALPERYAELVASITVTAPLMIDPDTDDDHKSTLKIPKADPAPSPYPLDALPPAYPQIALPPSYPHPQDALPPGSASLPQDALAPPPWAPWAPWATEPARPSWQRSLDGALVRVGGFLERAGGGAATRFREASPGERLALAVGGASLVAAILVLILFLLLG